MGLAALLELLGIGLGCGLLCSLSNRRYARACRQPAHSMQIRALFYLLAVLALWLSLQVSQQRTQFWDQPLLNRLMRPDSEDGWLQLFELLTWGGSSLFLTPVSLVIALSLYRQRYRLEASLLACSVAGGGLLILLLKALFDRARPNSDLSQWYWGSSFPSGHSLGATTFATALLLIACRLRPAQSGWWLSLAVLWIALIALSRLILGVHWPSDVLVAICIGLCWVLLLDKLWPWPVTQN